MSGPLRIEGAAYAIGGEVSTDTIIKSRRCTTVAPEALGPHCLAELGQAPPFTADGTYPLLFCDGTFGIGSARIHAPIALRAAGVRAVVAPAFGAIFFENCLNGAHLLPLRAAPERLPPTGAAVTLRIEGGTLHIAWDGGEHRAPCTLPDWALAGRRWMDVIEAQARAAGGLEALRARGLRME